MKYQYSYMFLPCEVIIRLSTEHFKGMYKFHCRKCDLISYTTCTQLLSF